MYTVRGNIFKSSEKDAIGEFSFWSDENRLEV